MSVFENPDQTHPDNCDHHHGHEKQRGFLNDAMMVGEARLQAETSDVS